MFNLFISSLDLLQMFSDLANSHILHGDIRWANIVSAPKSPPGWQGHLCPKHGVRHQWRIIDFDLSGQTKRPISLLLAGYELELDQMLIELARGERME